MFCSIHPVRIVLLVLITNSVLFAADQPPKEESARKIDYGPAVAMLEQAVREELKRGDIGGVAIALVDDRQTVPGQGIWPGRQTA